MKPMERDAAFTHAPVEGKYRVNEIFYSIQGEGVLVGTPMTFVRFSDCNLRCAANNAAGFDCDTEFLSGQFMSLDEIARECAAARVRECDGRIDMMTRPWMLLTGGEPALQVDRAFLQYFAAWNIAIETNGTIALPEGIEHICVSPKSAEHTLRQRVATEVKYVRRAGQALPEPSVDAKYFLVSPAFAADGTISREDLQWCERLVMENPQWRLSIQLHKILGVR